MKKENYNLVGICIMMIFIGAGIFGAVLLTFSDKTVLYQQGYAQGVQDTFSNYSCTLDNYSPKNLCMGMNYFGEIVLNYYGFETPFQRQQFFNCHEEMKKLESQASFHRTRIEKKVGK